MNSTAQQSTIAEDYISRLESAALAHRALHHPYLRALASNALPLPRQAIIDFAEQYAHHLVPMTDFLSTIEVNLDSSEHRTKLRGAVVTALGLYNPETWEDLQRQGLRRTDADGIPQHELFWELVKGVGGRQRQPGFPVQSWKRSLLALSNIPGGQEGIGALGLGEALCEKHIYQVLRQAIGGAPHLFDSAPTVLSLHHYLPCAYRAHFNPILLELAQCPQGRQRLAAGMFEALELKACIWDWLYERASLRIEEAVA